MEHNSYLVGFSIALLLGASSPPIIVNKEKTRYITVIENNEALYTLPTSRPFPDHKISSGFNMKRLHPVFRQFRPHTGIDIPIPLNTAVKAVGNGKVVKVEDNSGYGNVIDILHGLDKNQKLIITRYAHMSSICFQVGVFIKKGDIIGYSGNTGISTAPHLHFEVLVDNTPVNSEIYLQ